MKDWVDNQYAQGRVTMISDRELEQLVESYCPAGFMSTNRQGGRRHDKRAPTGIAGRSGI
jgi:hypothetical protein